MKFPYATNLNMDKIHSQEICHPEQIGIESGWNEGQGRVGNQDSCREVVLTQSVHKVKRF